MNNIIVLCSYNVESIGSLDLKTQYVLQGFITEDADEASLPPPPIALMINVFP